MPSFMQGLSVAVPRHSLQAEGRHLLELAAVLPEQVTKVHTLKCQETSCFRIESGPMATHRQRSARALTPQTGLRSGARCRVFYCNFNLSMKINDSFSQF